MGKLNITFRNIEERFQRLDRQQAHLARATAAAAARERGGGRLRPGGAAGATAGAATGIVGGDGAPHTADQAARASFDLDTLRMAGRVQQGTHEARDRMLHSVEGRIHALKAGAQRAQAEQRAVLHAVHAARAARPPPAPAGATGDGDVAIGTRDPPPPAAATLPERLPHDAMSIQGGVGRFAPLFAEGDEAAEEARIIEELTALHPTGVAGGRSGSLGGIHRAAVPPPIVASSPTGSPRPAGAPSSPLRASPSRGGGGGGAKISPYVNPRPLALRPRSARPRVGDAVDGAASATRARPSTGTVSSLARHFFAQLPPVVPPQKHPLLAQRVRGPVPPGGGPALPGGLPPSGPTAFGLGGGGGLHGATAAARTREFYFLHVRIVHTFAKLTDWEFCVVVTDVTNPDRLLRHTFKHLRVNPQMYLLFHPPSNVILSPVDDIPWVAAPESLFMHTLRLEVFATHPSHTKVVDTMVFFGDVLPSEDVAAGARPATAA